MKDNWIINKLKWMLIFGSIFWISILVTSCSALRNYTPPKDGVIYNGGTLTIIQSNGHQIIIKK
jgi:hypothetical protein